MTKVTPISAKLSGFVIRPDFLETRRWYFRYPRMRRRSMAAAGTPLGVEHQLICHADTPKSDDVVKVIAPIAR